MLNSIPKVVQWAILSWYKESIGDVNFYAINCLWVEKRKKKGNSSGIISREEEEVSKVWEIDCW